MQFTTMFVAAELAAVACAEGLCPASACKQNWKYKGIDQTPCSNPDNDSRGPWCPTALIAGEYVLGSQDFEFCAPCGLCPASACKQNWKYKGIDQTPCSNPDNDSRGPWCPTALIAGEYVLGSQDFEFCAPCGFVYGDQGKGKCVHLDGSAVAVKSGDWIPGAFSSCKERCNKKHECGGYSLSNKGNCLLYSAPKGQLRVDPDDQWGNSSCTLKLAIASAAEVTTTTATIAIPTTTTDATTSFVASAIRTTSTTTAASATASGAEVTTTTATIAIPTTTTDATTSSASSAIRTTSTTTAAAEVKEELAIVTLRRMRESFKTGFASHNARPILPALFLALWYFF